MSSLNNHETSHDQTKTIDITSEFIDCGKTIKLEIKEEIQETEDLQDSLSTDKPISTNVEDKSLVVKMENNL